MAVTYQLETLSPVALCQGSINASTLKVRPKSLEGQHIGLLWNSKRGGDVALRRAGQALEARFPSCQFTFFPSSIPSTPAILERVKGSECGIFLGATAD
jgi:hypothetical protein